MLTETNQRLADAYKRLYDHSKECGRCLSLASPDSVSMGLKNAMHLLCQQELPTPDEMAVALCEKTTEAEPVPPMKDETKE